jgi:RNA polymerase sigma factor (sigma-70 family)
MSYSPSYDQFCKISSAMGVCAFDRDEIVQEAIVSCLRFAQRTSETPKSGLERKVTRWRCRDYIRRVTKERRRFSPDVDLAYLPAREDDPAEEVARREIEEHVRNAVAALRPKYFDILRLSYWEGMPDTRIASFLGISSGCVRQRLSRARDMVRAKLQLTMVMTP